MNKFFFPTTLIAVLVIATVFAFVPVEEAQTLHLPTIGSAQISADSIAAVDIATGGVATLEILDGTIGPEDITGVTTATGMFHVEEESDTDVDVATSPFVIQSFCSLFD